MAEWYIEYADVAVGADKAAIVTATDTYNDYSLPNVPSGVEELPLITLEHNRWVLNGSFIPRSESVDIGYWSNALSNGEGVFDDPKVITASLSAEFSSVGIELKFQKQTEEWATNLSIEWDRGETVLGTENFTPNSSMYFCEKQVDAYNKIVITINSTSKPYRRLRVDLIAFGLYRRFDLDQILQCNMVQQLSPISAALPESSLSWELNNPDRINFMFQSKQPVNIMYDSNLFGTFYVKSSKHDSLTRYSIECEDAIGVLTDIPFAPVMYDINTDAQATIKSILQDHFEIEWDVSLGTPTIRGYLNAKTLREALQIICFAIGAVVSTTKTRKIKIFKLKTELKKPIDEGVIYKGSSIDKEGALSSLNVYSHSYTEVSDQKAGDDVIKIGDGHSAKYYLHQQTPKEIKNPNIPSNAKPNIMEIKEATLINSDNVDNLAQSAYNYLIKTNTHNFRFVLTNEDLGDYVEAVTPFEEGKAGVLEYMKMTFSGIVGVEGKYRFD
jgi:hypothetical protein